MKTNDNFASQTTRNHGEISRLLTAAVINEGFRKMLLTNPELALTKGYKGESFHLLQVVNDSASTIFFP